MCAGGGAGDGSDGSDGSDAVWRGRVACTSSAPTPRLGRRPGDPSAGRAAASTPGCCPPRARVALPSRWWRSHARVGSACRRGGGRATASDAAAADAQWPPAGGSARQPPSANTRTGAPDGALVPRRCRGARRPRRHQRAAGGSTLAGEWRSAAVAVMDPLVRCGHRGVVGGSGRGEAAKQDGARRDARRRDARFPKPCQTGVGAAARRGG